jgi:hypothetical protein
MTMEELTILMEGRRLLRSIRAQRSWCMKHRRSYIESDWAKKELNNLESALSSISSSAEMKKFLHRKQATIMYLMPSRNIKQREKLRELLTL